MYGYCLLVYLKLTLYTLHNIEIMCTKDTDNWQEVAKFLGADNWE